MIRPRLSADIASLSETVMRKRRLAVALWTAAAVRVTNRRAASFVPGTCSPYSAVKLAPGRRRTTELKTP